MSLHLRADQTWVLLCDFDSTCPARIVADPGTHTQQRAQLTTLSHELGWTARGDVDLCGAHSDALAREDLCRLVPLCTGKAGHDGECRVVEKKFMPPRDSGPVPGGKPWAFSTRRR